jgi:hypothetical protein
MNSRICGSTGESWGRKQRTGGGSNSNGSNNDGTDADLAKEMNELSVQERAKVLEELHGVAEPQEETPEFVSASIDAFDAALKKIPKPKRRATEKAFFLRPSFQNDQKFTLMFLRADYYDAQKAASRMIKYFEWKQRLFGEEKLGKDITLDDLHEKDIQIAVLSGGCLQLPDKDPTGRPVTMFDTSKIDHNYQEEMVRLLTATPDDDIVGYY